MNHLNQDPQNQETQPTKKIPFLSKITFGLFGVFLTSVIFAFFIKASQEAGIWISLIVSGILVGFGFKFSKKGSRLRLLSWSMLVTLIACITLYFVMLYVISSSLKDL